MRRLIEREDFAEGPPTRQGGLTLGQQEAGHIGTPGLAERVLEWLEHHPDVLTLTPSQVHAEVQGTGNLTRAEEAMRHLVEDGQVLECLSPRGLFVIARLDA